MQDVKRAQAGATGGEERERLALFAAEVGGRHHGGRRSAPDASPLAPRSWSIASDAAFARVWTLNEREVLELQSSAGMYTHIDGAHSRAPVGILKIGLIASERRSTSDELGDRGSARPATKSGRGVSAWSLSPAIPYSPANGCSA